MDIKDFTFEEFKGITYATWWEATQRQSLEDLEKSWESYGGSKERFKFLLDKYGIEGIRKAYYGRMIDVIENIGNVEVWSLKDSGEGKKGDN